MQMGEKEKLVDQNPFQVRKERAKDIPELKR
jgi:hypothetical protein